MNCYKFGSCRLLYECDRYSDCIHNTKEILQILKFIDMTQNELQSIYRPEFVFSNNKFYSDGQFVQLIIETKKSIDKSNIILIEISSLKEILFENIYFQYNRYIHHQKRNKNSKFNETNTKVSVQNKETLLNDLEEIIKKFKNKIVVLIPHIDSLTCGNSYIPNRVIISSVLEQISIKYNNVYFFNPMNYLDNDPKTIFQLLDNVPDFEHYSNQAKKIIKKKLNQFVNNIK